MLADELDYVVGVDTHRDEHVIAVVAAPAGAAMIAAAAAAANVRGYRELLRCRGTACAWSPCLGGRGQRQLRRRAWPVSSANAASWCSKRRRPPDRAAPARQGRRPRRRRGGAHGARLPRLHCRGEDERREALRLLLIARRSAVDVRREALTQLRAVIVTAPDELRQELRRLPAGKLLERCKRLRQTLCRQRRPARDTARAAQPRPRRIEAATAEAGQARTQKPRGHVRALAPALLRGARRRPDDVAAQLIVSWSHPGRLCSEAAFARLAGVAPIPASFRPDDPAAAQPRRRPPLNPTSTP